MSGYLYTDEENDWLRQSTLPTNDLVAGFHARFDKKRPMEGLKKQRERLRIRNWVSLPESEKPRWDEPLRLLGPSCVAIFDIHLPYQDAPFIERVINLGLRWGIDTLIIGGDLLDIAAFSKFGPDPEDILEEELAAAEDFMAPLAKSFKTVAYCLGNHEARLLGKALNRQLRSQRFLRLITHAPNVEITSYEYIIMDGADGIPWLFAHPKNSSIIGGRVPNMVGARAWSGYHVVSGHGHLANFGFMDDGRRYAIDSGMCGDPMRVQYAMKAVSNRPVMMQGAVIVKNSIPYLVHPRSDWAALNRMYDPFHESDGERVA